jgi:energy-coupling factor transporter ATP-binding protein EcfA2
VYQYGNETLDFGGGRLLLRGVNGSGKSTAMNMLLPFLLDADTRRIDAAGEQSGVLKAWMLSGRDEPHTQGYLWLEVAKGDAYLNFGCGIRANRATDQVATWWFITSRRIGLDLHLVEGRVPEMARDPCS